MFHIEEQNTESQILPKVTFWTSNEIQMCVLLLGVSAPKTEDCLLEDAVCRKSEEFKEVTSWNNDCPENKLFL